MKKKSAGAKASQKRKPPETVAAYLAGLDKPARVTLEKLRKSIKAAAPRATEGISYGIPTFKLDGKMLVSYAAWTNHCSFFPGSVIEEFEDELKDYKTSKGTIQFPIGGQLSPALVKKILKARMARMK